MFLKRFNIFIISFLALVSLSIFAMESQIEEEPITVNFDLVLLKQLLSCMQNDDIHGVRSILSKNPGLNLDIYGTKNPLAIAVRHNKFEIAELLIQNGADVNFKSAQQSSLALRWVNSFEMLQVLINAGANWNLAKLAINIRPILIAILLNCDISDIEKFRMIYLLASHVDINEICYTSITRYSSLSSALSIAQKLGYRDIVKLLLSLGAK